MLNKKKSIISYHPPLKQLILLFIFIANLTTATIFIFFCVDGVIFIVVIKFSM